MGRPPKSDLPPELSEILHQIGTNLSHLREVKGLSQAELARRAGISTTTLNEIETRRFRDIRISTLSQLAKALDTPVARLLHKTDVDLTSRDQARLLKASEDIVRIARKLKSD